MVRSKVIGMAAVIVAGLAGVTAANATPFGYGPPDREVIIEQVAGGCGPGFHPNPWGHCRPNGWGGWGGYGGRPGYGYDGGNRGGYGGGYGRGYGDGGPRRFGGGW